MYTLASDMFPRRAVGSVIGIAGMAGAVGGILMQAASGRIREWTGSYLTMFVIAGSVYLLSVLVIHALAPGLEPVRSVGHGRRRPTRGVRSMDDHGGTIDSLRRELVERHGVKPGMVRFARVPYRVCPLGAHVDHQLGASTAMALDVGLTLAYAPGPGPEVRLSSRDFPGAVRFSVDAPPGPPGRRLGRLRPGGGGRPEGAGIGWPAGSSGSSRAGSRAGSARRRPPGSRRSWPWRTSTTWSCRRSRTSSSAGGSRTTTSASGTASSTRWRSSSRGGTT